MGQGKVMVTRLGDLVVREVKLLLGRRCRSHTRCQLRLSPNPKEKAAVPHSSSSRQQQNPTIAATAHYPTAAVTDSSSKRQPQRQQQYPTAAAADSPTTTHPIRISTTRNRRGAWDSVLWDSVRIRSGKQALTCVGGCVRQVPAAASADPTPRYEPPR